MNFSQSEITQILKLLEDSSFDELDIKSGDLRLSVRRRGCGAGTVLHREKSSSLSTEAEIAESPGNPKTSIQVEQDYPIVDNDVDLDEALLSIKAPMLGTFYRRSAPNERPFVEVGSFVDEADTICVLEVMKVFNTLNAGVRGTIEKICVEDKQLVEFGQVLFLVRPEEGGAMPHKK